MQLDEFLYNLHFNIDQVRPVDVVVDWGDAPLPFKLYQHLPSVPLPFTDLQSRQSLGTSRSQRKTDVGLSVMGGFFRYSYGLTQLSHTLFPFDEEEAGVQVMQMLRRYAPSGGALYPNELYGYLKIVGLPAGIYHYDVAHHRLVCLREGNFDDYLERALGGRCNLTHCFGVLFVSTMFWKNFFKYNDFAYRLQGLDAGALMGQMLEVAKQYSFRSSVHFQFLDKAIHYLLGLRDEEETVYAVVPLSMEACAHPPQRICGSTTGAVRASTLCEELAELRHRHYVKSQNVAQSPNIQRINAAAMWDSTRCFTQMPPAQQIATPFDESIIVLPKIQSLDYDFAAACRQRYSPGLDFTPGGVSLVGLSTLLWETMSLFEYESDVALPDDHAEPRLAIAGCVHGVDGLADGAYIYDARAHALRLLRAGDHRMSLQQGLSMPNVNLFQVPLCLHIVGQRDFYQTAFGYRGYRIQQMEAGMLLQRLLLSAAALGMGGHPLLGYDVQVCDDIYDFEPQGRTCLIQVPVGHYRKRTRFEGMLRSHCSSKSASSISASRR